MLAEKVIHEAYKHNLTDRISKPLGAPPLTSLKCIRRFAFNEEYFNSD